MAKTASNLFYIENSAGQVVRSIAWDGTKLHMIYLEGERRLEFTEDLEFFKMSRQPFVEIETVLKKEVVAAGAKNLQYQNSKLKIVQDSSDLQPQIAAPKDDPKLFQTILKRTLAAAVGIMAFVILMSFIFKQIKPEDKPPLQIVHVMDRKQIEKIIVAPRQQAQPKSPVVAASPRKIQKTKVKQLVRNKNVSKPQFQQKGALGILGSLNKSNQRGGLNLNQIQTSPGPGLGGSQGSGGMQTAVYSKGLFAAPLGSGNRADGGGGYGKVGKGGGRAGSGGLTLVGGKQSYFEPVASDAWVEGGLDQNEIAAVIQRHFSEVRFCYERGLQTSPNLTGRISLKFFIGASGSVTSAAVGNSSMKNPVVETCIRDRLKGWKFPRPVGGVTVKVDYPFVFRRVSDSSGGVQ